MSAVKNIIKDNYNTMLLKDYLRDAIKDAGFSHADISKCRYFKNTNWN